MESPVHCGTCQRLRRRAGPSALSEVVVSEIQSLAEYIALFRNSARRDLRTVCRCDVISRWLLLLQQIFVDNRRRSLVGFIRVFSPSSDNQLMMSEICCLVVINNTHTHTHTHTLIHTHNSGHYLFRSIILWMVQCAATTCFVNNLGFAGATKYVFRWIKITYP